MKGGDTTEKKILTPMIIIWSIDSGEKSKVRANEMNKPPIVITTALRFISPDSERVFLIIIWTLKIIINADKMTINIA